MRFKKEFSPEQIAQLRAMAIHGLPVDKIANVMGISESTLERMQKHRPAVREAIVNGRAEGEAMITQTAYELASNGKNPGFTSFWLKAKAGWRDTTSIEITGTGGTNVLIDDMTPAQRTARLERLLEIREKIKPMVIDVTPSKKEDSEE